MSEIRANTVTDAAGTGSPSFPNGLSVASAALTGVPTAPTATVGTNTTQIATTAFVNAEISGDVGVANSSVVKTAVNASGSAPIYAARAWINFNGTASTIRNSGNVSSLTKNSTGNYTINFSTAMPHANYTVVVGGNLSTGGTETRKIGGIGVLATSTSSCSIITGATHAVSIEDYAEIHVTIIC